MSFGAHLDQSMDPLEETRFLKKHANLIRKLSKEVHFNYNEIEAVLLIYYKLKKDGGPNQRAMTKFQIKEVLHNGLDMTHAELCSLVVQLTERTSSIYYPMETWVRLLSLFLRGTLEEKIRHCFTVYNVMGTTMLTRDQMVNLLENCIIGEEDTEDEVKDLIEVLSKKMDVDRDGKVSYNDFKETVKKQPLLLEAFGPCLPTRLAVYTFLTTFTTRSGKI